MNPIEIELDCFAVEYQKFSSMKEYYKFLEKAVFGGMDWAAMP